MKNIFYTFIFLLSGIMSVAQSPTWQWAKAGSGTQADQAKSIVTDAGGNSYIAGYFESASITLGTTTLTNADNSGNSNDILIAKYDPSGNLVWAKKAGGSDNDYAMCIAIDPFGNLYVTGFFWSSTLTIGSVILNNSGNDDIFIAKFTSAGDLIWAKKAGGNGNEAGLGIVIDAAGNPYINGSFYANTLTLGSTTLTNNNTNSTADVFYAKLDSAGNFLWAKSFGGTGDDEFSAISRDALGNIYIKGCFDGPNLVLGSTTLTNKGNYDIFIAKFNSAGNVIWAKSAAGTGFDFINGLKTDASGNVYITGHFYSATINFDTTILTNTDNTEITNDVFIAKYDSSGNLLWVRQVTGTNYDASYGIAIDAAGYPYITGGFASPTITMGTKTLTNKGAAEDIFVLKYNSNGDIIWAKNEGGTLDDFSNAITLDKNGNVLIVGEFESVSCSIGSTVLANGGSYDFFISKLSSTAGIEEDKYYHKSFSVYPNPSLGDININYDYNIEKLEITNALGQVIYFIEPNKKDITLQLEKKGIYFITLYTNGQALTKKVVVQ